MTQHAVGIHQVNIGGVKSPASYRARCDDCGWEGQLRRKPPAAQQDAMEHQGGTLRIRERQLHKPDPTEGMAEMFPGAR